MSSELESRGLRTSTSTTTTIGAQIKTIRTTVSLKNRLQIPIFDTSSSSRLSTQVQETSITTGSSTFQFPTSNLSSISLIFLSFNLQVIFALSSLIFSQREKFKFWVTFRLSNRTVTTVLCFRFSSIAVIFFENAFTFTFRSVPSGDRTLLQLSSNASTFCFLSSEITSFLPQSST